MGRRGKSLVIHQSRGFGGSTVLCVKAPCMERSCNHLPSPLYDNVDLRYMSYSGQLLCKTVNPYRRRCQSIGTYPGMCPRFSTPTYRVSVLGLSQNHSQPVVWSVDLLCELESEIWIVQNGAEHNQRLSSWNSSSCSSPQDHLVFIFKQCFHNVHRSRLQVQLI